MNNNNDYISDSSLPLKTKNLTAQAAHIQAGFSLFPKNLSQESLLFIGPSRAGKSTIANYLLRTPLSRWTMDKHEERMGRLEEFASPVKRDYENRNIDHVYPDSAQKYSSNIPQINGVGSTTTHITAYKAGDLVLYDTPGFDDTDSNRLLANALMLEQIIQQSKKIKLAIVIDYNALDAGQGQLFQRFTELLSQLFFPEQLKTNNILFLITNKSERRLSAKMIRHALQQATKTLATRKLSVQTEDELSQLEKQIEIGEVICQISDDRLIFVNPLDNGETRTQIFETVKLMQPIDNSIFNFNTTEKIKFRDELRENFILPYLNLMRGERIMHELENLDQSVQVQLSAYKYLSINSKRHLKISIDLQVEEKKLADATDMLSQLQMNLNQAEQQLQQDWRPDEEVVYITMRGENRAYTLVEQTSMTSIVAASGFTGYSAYLATLQASAAYLFTSSSGGTLTIATAWGGSITCTSTLAAVGFVAGYAMIPAVVILGSAILAKQYSSQYVENNYPLTVSYSGTRFTRAEISSEIVPGDENTMVDYYEIDPEQIVPSADYRQCTAKFRKKQAKGTQTSQVLCILGKKENHPEFEPFITGLKNEVAELKADIMKYQRRIAISKKIIAVLNTLKDSTDDSTLDTLLGTMSPMQAQEPVNYLAELINVQKELEAISVILSYIDVTGILFNYQKEYAALRSRHPTLFILNNIISPQQSVRIKPALSIDSVSSTKGTAGNNAGIKLFGTGARKESKDFEVEEDDVSPPRYINPDTSNKPQAFLNAIKEQIKQNLDNYLNSKKEDKRAIYKEKVANSLDLVFANKEFQQLILQDYYHSIPEDKIPRLREKNEYLLSLIVYQAKKVQEMYQPVKSEEGLSAQSQFSVNVAAYIHYFWSALIIKENGDTEEEKDILDALHARIKGYFQQYKPSLKSGMFSITSDPLSRVLSSLRDGVFAAPKRRREILQFFRNIDNAYVPGNEEKSTYLLNIIQPNKDKIKALYKLAMVIPQDSDSQFATDVVQYIKDYWQPLLAKKSPVLSQDRNAIFAQLNQDRKATLTLAQAQSQSITVQIDRTMTTFKTTFIHCIEKTYRLFYVMTTEEVQPTRSAAMTHATTMLTATNITAGVNVPFVGDLQANMSAIMTSIIGLCMLVKDQLDKNFMRRFCCAFQKDETQRFNAVVGAALKLSVELSPELYHMSDNAIVELASIVVKRIICYITSRRSHIYSQQPSYIEQFQAFAMYAVSGHYDVRPTEQKDFTTICQMGMRTRPYSEKQDVISRKVGDVTSPTYQAILDHTGWIVLQEQDLVFIPPKYDTNNAFCLSQNSADLSSTFKNKEKLPQRIQDILDECVEIYRSEINNGMEIIPGNIFAYRRQHNTQSGPSQSVDNAKMIS